MRSLAHRASGFAALCVENLKDALARQGKCQYRPGSQFTGVLLALGPGCQIIACDDRNHEGGDEKP
jgi:hypothetical protein